MEVTLKDLIQFSVLLITIVGAYWNLRVRMTRLEDNKAERKELYECKAGLDSKADKDAIYSVKEELKGDIARIFTAIGEIKTMLSERAGGR